MFRFLGRMSGRTEPPQTLLQERAMQASAPVRAEDASSLRIGPAYEFAEETGITAPLVMSTINPRSAPVITR